MPPSFKIAHISDLHFTAGRFHEGPHGHSTDMLRGLEQHMTTESPIDLMVVSGDVSDEGDLDALLNAKTWLLDRLDVGDEIKTGLNLNPLQLAIVPGNHDAFNAPPRGGTVLDRRQASI